MSEERDTAREIAQDKVNNELMRTIGRLEGKVDSVLSNQEQMTRVSADHEKRITENENALYNIKLKVGLIGAFIGAVVSFIGNWIWGKLTGQK